jgi:hypothetical protein
MRHPYHNYGTGQTALTAVFAARKVSPAVSQAFEALVQLNASAICAH